MFEAGIFLGAFLLFHLQPLIAKHILPWYGSSPAVWTTCMLFFQTLLVGGYAYAHGLTRRAKPARQTGIHMMLLAAAIVMFCIQWQRWGAPMLPGAAWKIFPPDEPRRYLLLMLLVGVGLPYFVLATTNPLLQKWFTRARPGVSPYKLYVLSNLGSLTGLLAYPVVVERTMTLRSQAFMVAALFLVYAAICIACALRARSAQAVIACVESDPVPAASATAGQKILWLLLSFCGSVLLLAVTNHLCEEVAVVPLLWVVPLALYLTSFMIGFSSLRIYSRPVFASLFMVSSFCACIALLASLLIHLPAQIIIYSVLLLSACTFCHGELARLKPAPEQLTGFYLLISIGGATGGIFVGLIAPVIFRGFWEFHAGVMLCWVLLLVVLLRDRKSALHAGSRVATAAFIICGTCAFAWLLAPVMIPGARAIAGKFAALFFYSAAGIVGLLLLWLISRRSESSPFSAQNRRWSHAAFALSFAAVEMTLIFHISSYGEHALFASRNFFGLLRVSEFPFASDTNRPVRALINGNILHGVQFKKAEDARKPTAYYVEDSGFGLALLNHPRRAAPEGLRIGVVGLGAGTIAAYCRSNDMVRFYEINPAVADLSRGANPYFTFLRDAPGKIQIALGDGRLQLERDLASGGSENFDVLALDAFSSDAIPVHLLTHEAFELYLRHLRTPDGIIAINAANRFIDLLPVVRAHARRFGLDMIVVWSDSDDERALRCRWVLLTADHSLARREPFASRADKAKCKGNEVEWTDSFSNLLELLL